MQNLAAASIRWPPEQVQSLCGTSWASNVRPHSMQNLAAAGDSCPEKQTRTSGTGWAGGAMEGIWNEPSLVTASGGPTELGMLASTSSELDGPVGGSASPNKMSWSSGDSSRTPT